jgi:hypothetical protein
MIRNGVTSHQKTHHHRRGNSARDTFCKTTLPMGVAVYGLATRTEGVEGADGAGALLPLTRAALDVGAGTDGTDGSTSPARRFNCTIRTEEKKEKKWLKRTSKTIREKRVRW